MYYQRAKIKDEVPDFTLTNLQKISKMGDQILRLSICKENQR